MGCVKQYLIVCLVSSWCTELASLSSLSVKFELFMSLFRTEDASDEMHFDAGVNQCIEIYDSYLALWPLWQNTMNYLQQWHSSGQNVMKWTLVYPFCGSPQPSSMGGLPLVSYKRLLILTSIFHVVFFVFIKFHQLFISISITTASSILAWTCVLSIPIDGVVLE